VAHYTFDEGSGTTAGDSSGNNNTGTLTNGPTWTTDSKVGGGALQFDGVNDYATSSAGTAVNNLTAGTISVWIKPSSGGQYGLGRIISKGSTGGIGGFDLNVEGSPVRRFDFAIDYDGATDLGAVTSGGIIDFGVWQHVVVTWDGTGNGSGLKMYKNGTSLSLSTSNGVGSRVSDASNGLVIGNRSVISNRDFDGSIDDVRLYNRVLSAQDISDLFALGSGGTPSPSASDTIPPSVPSNLSATVVSSSEVKLAWDASTDNVGIAGYKIYRNGSEIASTAGTFYSDSGLSANTNYSYNIVSFDSANNLSSKSVSVSAITQVASIATTTTPAIGYFVASQPTIEKGKSATLSWTTTNATALSINQSIGVVTGGSLTVSPTQTVVYTLTAVNGTNSVSADVTVTVMNTAVTAGSENLLENSSFETPGDNFWGWGGSKIAEENLVADAVAGKYSLRWPYTNLMADLPYNNPYTGQHQAALVYQSVTAEPGQLYTLSASIKATTGGGQAGFQIYDSDRNKGFDVPIAKSPGFTLSNSWQRFSWPVTLPPSTGNKYVIRIGFPGDPPWQDPYPLTPRFAGLIDAVKFEKGSLSDYTTDSVEVGLYPKAEANAFVWGSDALIDVYLSDTGSQDFSGNIDLSLEDYFGTVVSQKTVAMSVAQNQRAKQVVSFGTGLRGHYRIIAKVNGVIKSEKIFSTIPPAKNVNPEESIFGIDSNLNNFALNLIKRLGITRIRPHADFGWQFVEPSQDKFVFPDYRVNLAKSKGLQLYGFLYRVPKWAGPSLEGMPNSLVDWEDYVFNIVNHYKNDIKYWEIFNEPGYQLSSAQYLSLVESARKGADRADPSAKLMGWSGTVGSPSAPYTYMDVKDQLLKSLNLLSAHYYPAGNSRTMGTVGYDMLKNHTAVISNSSLKLWNTEGGAVGGPTFYRTKGDYDPNDGRKDGARILSKFWVYHKAANVPLYYYWLNFPSGDHSPAYSFSWTLNEYDSSLKASAVVTAVAAYFLDGANIVFDKFVAKGDVTNDESVVMMNFVKDANNNVAVAWTDVPGKTVEIKNDSLPQAVVVYDMFGKNLANFSAGQKFSYTVTNDPVYFIVDSYSPSLIDRSFFKLGLVASNESILINETVSGDKSPIRARVFGSSNPEPSTNELLYSQNAPNGSTVNFGWDSPVHLSDSNTMLLYHLDQRSELGENPATVKDFSSNSRSGSLVSTSGGTLEFSDSYGKFAGGLKADGSLLAKSVRVANDSGLNNLSQFTIEMWLKSMAGDSSMRLFSKGDVNYSLENSPYAARIRETGRDIIFQVSDGSITRERWSTAKFPTDNTYHHLAFVFDGSPIPQEVRKMDIYLDGKLVNGNLGGTKDGKCPIAQSAPSPMCQIPKFTKTDSGNFFILGYLAGGPSSLFSGYADEFVMYNRALSANEIFDHVKLRSGKTYYWYSEFAGNTISTTPIRSSNAITTTFSPPPPTPPPPTPSPTTPTTPVTPTTPPTPTTLFPTTPPTPQTNPTIPNTPETPTTPTTPTGVFTKTLNPGDTGEDVRKLQILLIAERYNLTETGVFDAKTEEAVKNFQCDKKIVCFGAPNGGLGPTTKGSFGTANLDTLVALNKTAKDRGLFQSNATPLQPKSTILSVLPVTTQAPASTFRFTRSLTIGSRGPDVLALQKRLNAEGFTIATGLDSTGSPRAGSPGNETTYFGPATRLSVIRFQEKYKAEILTPNNLTRGTGFVGQATLKKLKSL